MNERDFDKFLSDANKAESARRTLEEIQESVVQKLRDMNVPRVYDSDPTINAELSDTYIAQRAEWYVLHRDDVLAELDCEVPDSEEAYEIIDEYIIRIIQGEVEDRNESERQVVSIIALMLGFEKVGSAIEHLSDMKKRYLADRVIDGASLQDPMMRFFAKVAPGETLEPDNPADQEYLIQAMIDIQKKEAQKEENEQVLNDMVSILRNEIGFHNDDMYKVAIDLLSAGMYNQPFGDRDRARLSAEREEVVLAVCRKHGIESTDPQLLLRLIMPIINASYPID